MALGPHWNRSSLLFVVGPISILGIAGCFAFLGCDHKPSPSGVVQGSGPELDSLDKVGVGCPAGKMAILTLAGDAIPVAVACTSTSGTVDIKLTAHGAVFEQEQYLQTQDSFDLLNAAGETYDPPIPLARAPMHIGDKWNWSGKMKSGDVGHVAKATITTMKERLFPAGAAPADAVKVQVDFEVDGGGPTPAKRRLVFWMAQNLGVIKRQFGETSMREPAGP